MGMMDESSKLTSLIGDVPVKVENRVNRMERGSFLDAMLHVDTLVQASQLHVHIVSWLKDSCSLSMKLCVESISSKSDARVRMCQTCGHPGITNSSLGFPNSWSAIIPNILDTIMTHTIVNSLFLFPHIFVWGSCF